MKFKSYLLIKILNHLKIVSSKGTYFLAIKAIIFFTLSSLVESLLAISLYYLLGNIDKTNAINLENNDLVINNENLFFATLFLILINSLIKLLSTHSIGKFTSKFVSELGLKLSNKMIMMLRENSDSITDSKYTFLLSKALDLYNIQILRCFMYIISALIPIILLLAILLIVSKNVSIIIITALAISYIFISFLSEKNIRKRSKIQQENDLSIIEQCYSSYRGFSDILTYNSIAQSLNNYNYRNKRLRNDQTYIAQYSGISRIVLESIGLFLIIALTGFYQLSGGIQSSNNIGLLAILVFILQKLLLYGQLAATSYSMINSNNETIRLVDAILNFELKFKNNLYIQVKNTNKNISKQISINNLRISNLINVDLVKNRLITIKGESGSGKTTLLKALCGIQNFRYPIFYDSINNQNKKYEYTSDELRRLNLFSYCPQKGHVFSGTLLQNITMKFDNSLIPNKEFKRIKFILELLNLNKTLNQRHEDLNTMLSSTDNEFSGGEIQRISLARAIYNQPQILFLDESTSAIDSRLQKVILDKYLFSNESKINNIIYISHENDLIEKADYQISIPEDIKII